MSESLRVIVKYRNKAFCFSNVNNTLGINEITHELSRQIEALERGKEVEDPTIINIYGFLTYIETVTNDIDFAGLFFFTQTCLSQSVDAVIQAIIDIDNEVLFVKNCCTLQKNKTSFYKISKNPYAWWDTTKPLNKKIHQYFNCYVDFKGVSEVNPPVEKDNTYIGTFDSFITFVPVRGPTVIITSDQKSSSPFKQLTDLEEKIMHGRQSLIDKDYLKYKIFIMTCSQYESDRKDYNDIIDDTLPDNIERFFTDSKTPEIFERDTILRKMISQIKAESNSTKEEVSINKVLKSTKNGNVFGRRYTSPAKLKHEITPSHNTRSQSTPLVIRLYSSDDLN